MIDIKKHEYEQEDYELFLRYIKNSWGTLLDWDWFDWKEEVSIDRVIVSGYKNNFEVFVFLKGNPEYYDLKDGELVEVVYDGKAIKTEYSLNAHNIVYMLLKGSIIEDLGLSDVEFIISDYVDGIEVNEDLSKALESYEGDFAETLYCIEHDL